ncbi:MAG: secretin N-terminal domain-containing protein, partial [Planctomycetota bacterium]|nr:secretin N-terminal domain-containing protein [Planctomycetota bacterium]
MPRSLATQPTHSANLPDRLTIASQIELPRLVDLAAARLTVKIEYDPAVLKGSVALRGLDAMDGEQLWYLTNQLLAARGFTTVKPPGATAFSVVRLQDAAALAGLGGLPSLVEVAHSGATGDATEKPDGHGEPVPAVEPAVQNVPGVNANLIAKGNAGAQPPGEAPPRGTTQRLEPRPGFSADVVKLEHLSPKDAADAAKLVLSKSGATATPLGKNLLLLADLTPRIADARRLLAWLDRPSEAGLVDEIPLKNISAAALVSLANQIGGKRDAANAAGAGAGASRVPGDLIAAPGGQSVILVSPPEHAAYWKALVAQLDKREGVVTTTYAPKVFSVRDVAALLDQAVRPSGSGGATGGASGGGDDRWRVVQDELTGSLIITATPAQHAQVVELLDRLESSPRGGPRPLKSFPIRNRPVGDVLATLNKLIDAGVLETGEASDSSSSAPGIGSTASSVGAQRTASVPLTGSGPAGQTSPVGGTGAGQPLARGPRGGARIENGVSTGGRSDLTLTADEGTNTLIAIAEPRRLTQLEDLIASLDVRQPQVMLEAYLVSLSQSQSRDLGVELERLASIGNTNIRLASLFGLSTASGNTRSVGDSAGGTVSALNPGEFSVVLKALETVTSGRSVSLPKVLVNNNETANFSSVLQQPYATTNASSSTVTTTTFGGTQDAGTTIQVRPQIAEGDHLVLQYSL